MVSTIIITTVHWTHRYDQTDALNSGVLGQVCPLTALQCYPP